MKLTLLLLTLIGGQQNPAEMTVHEQPAVFRTAVNMVDVPVVVRDYKGRAVGSLTKDDFQLFDRGKQQKIVKFTLEKSMGPDVIIPMAPVETVKKSTTTEAIPAAVLPERFIAYLFDDVHVKINDLAMARDAADRHMKRSLGPKTRAAIFTTSGQVMLDFTDDRDKWHEYLYRLRGLRLDRHDECLTFQQAYAIQHGWNTLSSSSGPPSPAPRPLSCRIDPRPAAALEIARTEYTTGISLDVLRDLVKRMAVLPGERTVVLASPGFITENVSKEWESVIDHAIHATVVINSLDVRGLYTDTQDLTEPPINVGALREENRQRTDVMAALAYGTGGVFFHNSNDLDTGFDRVAGNPEYRYILSFAPADLKSDGSVHSLKVSIVPNPHHYNDIVARDHYVAPKPLSDPVEATREEMRVALFSRDEVAEIPADMHPGFTRLGPGKARVSVQVHVGVETLHFKKAEGRNAADLTVMVGLFNHNGDYVNGKVTGVELRLKEENLSQWLKNGVKLGCNLEAAPGEYLVRLVVRDSEGHAMAARNGFVDIP